MALRRATRDPHGDRVSGFLALDVQPRSLPLVDVVVLFLLVVVVIAALGATRAGWIASAVAAAMTLLVVGLATWFVFSEDGYVAQRLDEWRRGQFGA